MSKYLYGGSVKGIQNYIFSSNELKLIMGASKIVGDINDKIKKRYEQNIIINAAGNIKLIFDENEFEELSNLVKNFQKEIRQSAYGVEFVQAVVKFEEGKLKEAFKELEKRLAIQRNKPQIPIDKTIFAIKIAPKSGRALAREKKDVASLQKEESFKRYLAYNPDSITEIPKNKNNKTAFIHADGNSLGAKIVSMLEGCGRDDDVKNAYQKFSSNLNKATKNAFEIAAKGREKEIRNIILDGDDLSIVCNANMALEFCKDFMSEFEQQSQNLMKPKLTMCAGIAFANHKFPFHYAINLAESLCVYAKKISKSINENTPPSSLMFHNIHSSSVQSYDDFITKELTIKNDQESIGLNYGPYFLEKQSNFGAIEDFLEVANLLKAKGSPLSRLRDYLALLSQNSNEAKLRLERIEDMIELKGEFNLGALESALKKLNENLSFKEPFAIRGNSDKFCLKDRERKGLLSKVNDKNKKFCPIYDLVSYLSVGDDNEI